MRQSAILTSFATSSGTIRAISSKEYIEKDIALDKNKSNYKGKFEDGTELYAGINSYYYIVPESSPLFNFYLVPNSLQSIEREGFSKFIRDARKMVIDMTT
jgi:hypothetical protein